MRIRCRQTGHEYALEGSSDDVVLRLLAAMTGFTAKRIMTGHLSSDDFKLVVMASEIMMHWAFECLDDDPDDETEPGWLHISDEAARRCTKPH